MVLGGALGPGFGACDAAPLCVAGVTSTFVSRGRRGTNSHLPSFCVAGVALMVLGGALGPGFGACDAAPLCVACVAQPDIHLRFTWQGHKLTSTVVLRGRRGTYGTGWRPWAGIWRLWRRATLRGRRGTTWHPPSFHVAGVAQTHIYRRFAWQAWDRWHWVAGLDRLGRLGRLWRRATLRGRRGTTWHPPSFHVAGVAQTHIYRRFAWQACHLWYRVAPLGRDLAPVTPRHFAWQAWHNLTSTFVSRGRRGTNSHLPSFCVAGVPLMVLGGALGPGFGACDAAPLCVAGVAQPDIHLRFRWQAWHKLTSTVVLRGRRGTYGTGWRPWAGIWRLWRRATLRGRRGTTWHPPSFHVAGVAQTHIYRHFAWQAWHLWYWVAPLGRDLAPVTPRHFVWQAWHNLTSTFVSRGMRGTNSHPPSFCVAGVGQMALGGGLGPAWAPVTPRHFAWQAWHNLTSTFVSRGRRGTNSHPPSFCVAGVGQMALGGALGPAWAPVTPRHFAWQTWHLVTFTFVSRGRCGTWWHPPSFRVAGMVLGDIMWHPPSFCVAGLPLGDMHLPCVTHHLLHTIFDTPSFTPLCHTPSLTHRHIPSFTHHLSHTDFVTRHLSHTTLSHTNFVTHHLSHTNFVTHHLSHTSLSHPTFDTPSFTHHIVTHHLSHTIFHTPLCHIPSLTHRFVTHHFVTHHIVTHHLSHITLSHTIFHTPSFTHHFVTYHLWHTALSHTIFHTPPSTHHFVTRHLSHTVTDHLFTPSFTHHLSHNTLSRTIFHHTIFHTPLCHTPSFTTPSFTHNFVAHHLSPHHL